VPADVVATVLVLQGLEGHSDRDAIKALRRDIAWKAAAGLALTDEAFHPTVLTLWRNKLRGSGAPQRIFDAVRQVIVETGVIAAKHRRVLDWKVSGSGPTRDRSPSPATASPTTLLLPSSFSTSAQTTIGRVPCEVCILAPCRAAAICKIFTSVTVDAGTRARER
jgi:hypothetical protein